MLRKRMLSVIAATAATLMLAACSGGGGDAADDDKGNKADGGEKAAGGTIAIITVDVGNPYWNTQAETAKKKAEELGYKTTVGDHKNQPDKQKELMQNAISAKSAAIILDNAGADASIGLVEEATEAGIPVFLVNAEINETGIAKAQIVSNNAQGAEEGAKEFVKAMDGKGKYVELVGAKSDNNADIRSNSYHTVIDQYDDMEMLQQEIADWDLAKGKNSMSAMLQAHPDIKGVISGNDQMALGAIAAIEEAGRDGIIVMGFDGNDDAVEAIKNDRLLGTVLQPVADGALMAVEQAHSFITTGETGVDKEKQPLDCTLITKDNADKLKGFVLSD